MSADISDYMSDVWTRWQGHLINGVFPLGRFLGCSDHSGVFLTRSAGRSRSEIAIKLVPANRALAEYQLPRWKRAGGLGHPHLLRLFEWGGCQLDGSPYLYAVMEYADQTLAQLLPRRALTDAEAREMLGPVLEALAFLHEEGLVHGQLKPANVLVVGDQLKLASDTIRRTGEQRPSGHAPSVYDPPESLPGTGSRAGDVWALGITLCEALTRRPPSTMSERGDALALPSDLSPEFRPLIARCLSLRPQDRPGVPELMIWARGQVSSTPSPSSPPPAVPVRVATPARSAQTVQPATAAEPATTAQPATTVQSTAPVQRAAPAPVPPAMRVRQDSNVAEPEAPRATPAPGVADATPLAPAIAQLVRARPAIAVVLGVIVIGALSWGGLHLLGVHRTPAASPGGSPAGARPVAAAAMNVRAPAPGTSAPTRREGGATPAPSSVHEVIPEVPLSARRTIHGHIQVWVRVTVEQDGSVSAAATDVPGPSRYFQRLALQAARKWTFPPSDASPRRHMQIRFEFSRDGTRGRAVPLH